MFATCSSRSTFTALLSLVIAWSCTSHSLPDPALWDVHNDCEGTQCTADAVSLLQTYKKRRKPQPEESAGSSLEKQPVLLQVSLDVQRATRLQEQQQVEESAMTRAQTASFMLTPLVFAFVAILLITIIIFGCGLCPARRSKQPLTLANVCCGDDEEEAEEEELAFKELNMRSYQDNMKSFDQKFTEHSFQNQRQSEENFVEQTITEQRTPEPLPQVMPMVHMQSQVTTTSFHRASRSYLEAPCVPQLSEEQQAKIKAIHDQGRVEIATTVLFKDPIEFMPASEGKEITARYRNQEKNLAALRDVSDFLKVYQKAVVLIEGHIAAKNVDDWATKLAQARAEHVKITICSFGVDPSRILSSGLPGHHGLNRDHVQIKILSYSDLPPSVGAPTRILSPSEFKQPPSLTERQASQVRAVLERGRISIHPQVLLKQAVTFVGRHHGGDSTAKFENEGSVRQTLSDVAMVMKIYNTTTAVVEGHTASADRIDEWSHKLALNRAEVVKSSLLAFGIEARRISTVGLPGSLGTGHSEVIIKFDSF